MRPDAFRAASSKGAPAGVAPAALRTRRIAEDSDNWAVRDDPQVFHGTASWYARYRPRYPDALIEGLAEAAGLDGTGRLLDLGTGPGFLAVPLAAYVEEVVAVDPEPEMLAELPDSIRAVEGRAEDVDATWGPFRLVTIGRAFHWMDPAVLDRLPTDRVALIGDDLGDSEPMTVVRETAEELLGKRPPLVQPIVRYADALAASPFNEVTKITAVEECTWTIEELLGFAYSTSYASLERLGDVREDFERTVHERLQPTNVVRASFDALLGRRSDQ